ncbi:MAG: GNAT family N-acetyltransferase [Flavobacterium sp.]
MLKIKKITVLETFEVRHLVLRKGKPIENCHFEGDDLPSTQHFGLEENNQIIGIISLFDKNSTLFSEKSQTQIRGMAVLENHQNKGYGRLLVEHCENILKKENKSLIWFNARENAVGFYTRMGYQTIGAPFEINDIGLHWVMYKKL